MKKPQTQTRQFPLALLIAVIGLCLSFGCAHFKVPFTAVPQAEMVAAYTAVPPTLDGKLDDACWQNAQVYPMSQGRDKMAKLPKQYHKPGGAGIIEEGTVKLAWDDQFFYVAANFTDSDVVAEGKEDQQHHYSMGDVVEVFMKPETQTWYWEMYGTPAAKKTCFFFPGRGRLWLASDAEYPCNIKVAAAFDGTLNNWQDRDHGWSAELAIPLSQLTTGDTEFEPGAPWRILVARYNYSRYLPWNELSMAPQMKETNFHLLEGYARLILVK